MSTPVTRWAKPASGDLWIDPDSDPRRVGPDGTDERSVLLDYLRFYRMTLEMKCADLDTEQLARRSVPPSTMSLLGLVRHMAEVERGWFRRVMAGQDAPKLYCTADAPEEDWDGARPDEQLVSQAWQAWRDEVAFAEQYLAQVEDLGEPRDRHGKQLPLREIVVHMVEEYARHCGHADLLRECIDGRIGQ